MGKGVDVLTPVWYDNRRACSGGPYSGQTNARTAAAGRFGAARRKKEEEIIMEGIKAFLKRKNIEISAKRYGIDALGAMAQGLFASLLIGTIINTVGTQFGIGFLTQAVVTVGSGEKAVAYTVGGLASAMSGPAMACAIGWALHCPPLVLFSLITPLVTIFVGVVLSAWWAPAIGKAASSIGGIIMWATELQPFFMGIVVSVIIGVALTLPISSAAICAALGLTGLAGGAAVAGCCAQMVGFAVMSYKENGVGGLVSQGIGTSMLQMGNIVRNPRIWIPPTLASAITGPIATCLFHFQMNGAPISSGMGTCGLVGQIGVYTGWVNDVASGAKAGITSMDWIAMVLVCFVLPAVLSVVFCEVLRRMGWIKENDLKLD